jgi:acetyl-CoA acetyltransferase
MLTPATTLATTPAPAELRPLRDRTAIAGVGYTNYTKHSGVSTLALAVEAITKAVHDAGLSISDIDGIATHHVNDSVAPHHVAAAFGLGDLAWYSEEFGGGSKPIAVVGAAAQVCANGMARHVVVYRAMNGRSGTRMGGSGGGTSVPSTDLQYQRPYGLVAPAQIYALGARAHMIAHGTQPEHLGMVGVQQRAQAADNPRALMRTPFTLDEYFRSRLVVDPFRLLDCCLETDGACAVVITTTERARDMPQPVVVLSGWAWAIGTNGFWAGATKLDTTAAALVAPRLYSMAGVGPGDIDVAELYDAFSISVLLQLEDYGFCAKGESGPLVASGATARGGALPVNTHGGFMSEGYVHGLNHLCEAVEQLRGIAGVRQVPGCEVALSTSQPGYISGMSSAAILRRL